MDKRAVGVIEVKYDIMGERIDRCYEVGSRLVVQRLSYMIYMYELKDTTQGILLFSLTYLR